MDVLFIRGILVFMNKILCFLVCMAFCACTNETTKVNVNEHGTEWKWDGGTIVVNSPEREPGQKSVLGLTVPKMEVVRVGFVGLGMRGPAC